MEYRLLGRSGLKVSAMTMGTMTFGGKDSARSAIPASPRRSGRSTSASMPASTCIDTADVYSAGASEEIIGEALGRQARRRADRHQGALSRWATGRTTAASPAIT